MKCKTNAKFEDALASKFLPGVNLGFWRAPQHDFLPLKASKMATNVIWLVKVQYRPQEGRWALVVFLTRVLYFSVVELRYSEWKICDLGG